VGCVLHTQRERRGKLRKHLRLFAAAPWDQQRLWRVHGTLEEQELVQKPQEWEAQAGRGRVQGDFSAKRGAAGIKCMSLS